MEPDKYLPMNRAELIARCEALEAQLAYAHVHALTKRKEALESALRMVEHDIRSIESMGGRITELSPRTRNAIVAALTAETAVKPFDVKSANAQLCADGVDGGHVFPRIPVKECLRCHEQFLLETPTEPVPTWEDLRGAAPDATGDMSSEAFVRKSRDEWETFAKPKQFAPIGEGTICSNCTKTIGYHYQTAEGDLFCEVPKETKGDAT
jgi:hypothetical protein